MQIGEKARLLRIQIFSDISNSDKNPQSGRPDTPTIIREWPGLGGPKGGVSQILGVCEEISEKRLREISGYRI